MATKLEPMENPEHLAKLCARLHAPFASPGQVLEEVGVSQALLERARERWSAAILADAAVGRRFQQAYVAERQALAEGGAAQARAPAVVTPTPQCPVPATPAPTHPVTPSPSSPLVDVDATVMAPRIALKPALPFQPGAFEPEPTHTDPRPAARAPFDPDSTLPLRPGTEGEPALPFIKRLPSQGLAPRSDDKKGRR